MNSGSSFGNLLAYLRPHRRIVLTRSSAPWHLRVLVALLAAAAIAGAVVLTPSRRDKPDVWDSLRRSIADRAQVDLFDDFSGGLDAWENGDHGASTWSYDNNGFVNPGALSLLSESMPLTNYDVDALVQIEAKGLGLAFRATGPRDYQAARLIVETSERMPAVLLERYAVVAGKAAQRIRVRFPGRYQPDTLYRIHLQVRGDAFTLYIQGQLVDYWSDARLKSGGVGWFCSAGEHARVAWTRVSQNSDSVGKLCSLLSSLL
jgi:hypothetical protein